MRKKTSKELKRLVKQGKSKSDLNPAQRAAFEAKTLQAFQCLCPDDAQLLDMVYWMLSLLWRFGPDETIEASIQHFVGLSLFHQRATRKK